METSHKIKSHQNQGPGFSNDGSPIVQPGGTSTNRLTRCVNSFTSSAFSCPMISKTQRSLSVSQAPLFLWWQTATRGEESLHKGLSEPPARQQQVHDETHASFLDEQAPPEVGPPDLPWPEEGKDRATLFCSRE